MCAHIYTHFLTIIIHYYTIIIHYTLLYINIFCNNYIIKKRNVYKKLYNLTVQMNIAWLDTVRVDTALLDTALSDTIYFWKIYHMIHKMSTFKWNSPVDGYIQICNRSQSGISGNTVVSRVSSIYRTIYVRRYRVSLREPARCEHSRFSDLNND